MQLLVLVKFPGLENQQVQDKQKKEKRNGRNLAK